MKLTIEEANQILSYIAKQPYNEVAGLIQMIVSKQEKPAKDEKKKDE